MEDQRAVALQYTRAAPAPVVLAKGKGLLAKKLVNLARDSGIAVIQDADLVERLFYVETGRFIPEPFYQAVAEILALVFAAEDGRPFQKREEERP